MIRKQKWWLIALLAVPLMAQQPSPQLPPQADPPASATVDQLKLENAQLRLQIAQLKEQLLQMQYQLVQTEKTQAQRDVDEAQKQNQKNPMHAMSAKP